MNKDIRIALTGFMGVGKSSVARHLAHMIKTRRLDLDHFIEKQENRRIAEIIDTDGIDQYRVLESKYLRLALAETHTRILSLGGGTWTIPANRETPENKRLHDRLARVHIRALLAKHSIFAQRSAVGSKQAERDKTVRRTAKGLLPRRLAFHRSFRLHVLRCRPPH